MVRCKDDSLYIGIAKNPDERVKRHNWGVGPVFAAKRRPVELIWSERCGSSAVARRREKEIKSWTRQKKLELLDAARPQGKPFEPASGGLSG
jgi:putative endonuclease